MGRKWHKIGGVIDKHQGVAFVFPPAPSATVTAREAGRGSYGGGCRLCDRSASHLALADQQVSRLARLIADQQSGNADRSRAALSLMRSHPLCRSLSRPSI